MSAPSRNSLRVFDALRRVNRPLTAYQLLKRIEKNGVAGPPTVYRALKRLTKEGLVHRIESLNAYMVCACPNHAASPLFVICEQCGSVSELSDKVIDARVRRRAEAAGFDLRTTSIEIRGACAACRASGHHEATQCARA
jgi:Fur family zinc uptake transcriptional regulator